MHANIILILILTTLLPLSALAQLQAEITRFGTYDNSAITNTAAAGDIHYKSATGHVNLKRGSDKVQAVIGAAFGFQFRFLGTPTNTSARLTYCVIPPVTLSPPSGNPISRLHYDRTVAESLKNPVIGFVFREPWQCQPGEWIVALQQGDTVLTEMRFLVRPRH